MTCTDATAHHLAAPPRPLPLTTRTVPTEPVTAPLVIERRTDAHGRHHAVVTGIGVGAVAFALDLRAWADQLAAAADVIDAAT